ncbi:MAG: AAA family ATPase [Deltaproteobacteria bacterium]|nr:AAA family ATPase [Deltaproteobacteria bacterium]
MISPPGYQITAKICESLNTVIYRGKREADNLPVILKILKKTYPAPDEIARYRHEFRITSSLHLEGVVRPYSLKDYKNRLAIIFEDFNGKSLDRLIAGSRLSMEEILAIAIKIVDALGRIHAANIIHKDINPANIVINYETGELKIIDFGISSTLSREEPAVKNPNILEGTLAYISPEQTGRMNRVLDYRTDFYSLGVILYELICRKLPFESDDLLEIIHSHIAKEPVAPYKLDQRIYRAVSEITMKLLAKNAEDRYQSAWGIKADLEECLSQLKNSGKIEPFPLARHDMSDRFHVFQKLYGREKEIEILMKAFERTANGRREILLVTGIAGIGKTSIVREIYKPITARNGYFVSGKFDQFHRDIPYKAVVETFQELIRQILGESDTRLNQWREKLLASLGPNGQIIIDVIPNVELIIGQQPPVPKLGPFAAQNRFNLVFQNFIQALCQPDHPLTIFLDDMQWADSASLKLMQLMITNKMAEYFFLIGAYRDNQVAPGHPVMITLNEIKKEGISINHITLFPLDIENITQLLSDLLHADKKTAKPLAELVMQKTGGNPFFAEIFLKSLYEEKLLRFVPPAPGAGKGEWEWDMAGIQRLGITDNVVELLAGKILQFSKKTQQALKLGSCIGVQFDLQTLAAICKKSPEETAASLQEAIAENLVIISGDAYKLINPDINELAMGIRIEYRFSHDHIHHAAYSLISETEKKLIHQQTGQHLLRIIPPEQRKKRIFDIVNQLNLGLELIDCQADRNELAKLNLMAGRIAKQSAAFESAFFYLRTGIGLLCEDNWKSEYDMSLELYTEAAEAAYLCAEYALMEEFVLCVLKKGKVLLDRAKAYEIRIEAYKAQYKLQEALETGLSILKELGLKFPEKPNKLNIILDLLRTKLLLAGKRISKLVDLKKMDDPIKLASMRILNRAGSAAYFADPDLLPLLVLRSVRFSIKYGNAPVTSFSYAVYGMILCWIVGDIETGYRFGRLALSVLEQFNAKEFKAMTFHMVYGFVIHWKDHIRETLKPLSEGYQIGIETGDFEYGGYCAFFYCSHSFVAGKELDEVELEMAGYSDAIGRLKHEQSLHLHGILRQTVANLRGMSETRRSLDGEYYNEGQMLPIHSKAKDRTTLYYLYSNKLFLNYLFCDYIEAIKNGELAKKYLDGVGGIVVVLIFFFYDSLARLAVFHDSSLSEQRIILKKVAANLKKIKKWAHHAPKNHLHRFYLIEAERMRILGKDAIAEKYYDQAIELAKKHEYINEEALANELAARFYLAKENSRIARAYIQDARYSYLIWGAMAKVRDIDVRYSQLLAGSPSGILSGINKPDKSLTTIDSGECLDLASVMKASLAISGEIVLDRLQERLMRIAIENAGAEKGFLILKSKGTLMIEAEGSLNQDHITVLHSVPLEKSNNLSPAIINYVARTRESVVLNDAATEGRFTNDPYILSRHPKSVLCEPIIYKSKLRGVLYLENNLTTGAFTLERKEMLKLLTSQIAISLENARLYTNLEESELRYRELYENIIDIVILVSADDTILIANPLFYTFAGIPYGDKIDFTFKEWIYPEDRSRVDCEMLTRLLKGNDVKDFEFRIVNRHGKVFEVECNARSIRKEDKLTGFQMVIRDVTERKKLTNDLFESLRAVEHARIGTILGLARLAEYRDKETGAHLERIQEYTRMLAEELSKRPKYKKYISKKYIEDVYFTSVLHDIGKVGIPDSILLKSGRLTKEEFEVVKCHPIIGGDVLREVNSKLEGQSFLSIGVQIAYCHHEKWNGTGYPKGLKGEEIPLSARIVALADVYDALATKRVYKDAYSHKKTVDIIISEKGKHFDPEVVEAFLVLEDRFMTICKEMCQDNEPVILGL